MTISLFSEKYKHAFHPRLSGVMIPRVGGRKYFLLLLLICFPALCFAQQSEVQKWQAHLSAAEVEERRDAVMRLGQMARSDASLAAATALTDARPIVRATAARAILSLPNEKAAQLLLPLLQDKDEFVRRETAYALGETKSKIATRALMEILARDKSSGARGAAAVALGQIKDEAAVPSLIAALGQGNNAAVKGERTLTPRKKEDNDFVRRSAARALGEIKSPSAATALAAIIASERTVNDVRREAAQALGQIGGPVALESLRNLLTSTDPYLSRIAYEALRRLEPSTATKPAS